MPNEVAFSAAQTIDDTSGASVSVGTFEARPYQRIRVPAGCFGDGGGAEINISFQQGESAPGLLGNYVITPGASVQQVYDVPGVILHVDARPITEFPTNIFVWVWGYRLLGE